MSEFISRWSEWQTVGTSDQATDITAKRQDNTSGTSDQAADITAKSQESAAGMGNQATDITAKSRGIASDMARQATAKTDKTPFVGSVSDQPEHFDSNKAPDLTVPDAGEVEAMTLNTFAQAGLVVQVDSDVLGASVLFVSDNVPESMSEASGLPVYRAQDLRKLVRLGSRPRDLYQLHMIKEIFQGSITGIEEVDDV